MNNLTLIFVVLISFNNVNAQFTNGQVFNYEIGDVLQTSYSSGNSYGAVHIDTIVNKVSSSSSITYTIKRTQYIPFSSPEYSVETLVVSGLSSLTAHFNYSSCLPVTDLNNTGNCNENIHRRESNGDTSCFEYPYWYSEIYEGLGGPYYYCLDASQTGSGSDWFSKKLTYYNTFKNGECGNYQFAGLNDLLEAQILIYPNPASNSLQVSTIFQNWDFQIESENGSVIFEGKSNQLIQDIDITNLQIGFYYLIIKNNDGRSVQKSFVKLSN